MITQNDQHTINEIRKFIDAQINGETKVDWAKVQWIETLDRITENLKIAPDSYRYCSEEEKKRNFYTAECDKCGWWGSSKFLGGGGAIADTGDYSDCFCPVCGNTEIDEKEEIKTIE